MIFINSKHKSISTKITLLIIVTIALITSSISSYTYCVYKKDSIKYKGFIAQSAAITIASTINAEELKEIIETNEKTDYYIEFQKSISDIKARSDLTYLYVIVKNSDNTYKYIFSDVESDFGTTDKIDGYGEESIKAYNYRKDLVSKMYYSKGYGDMVSAFSPIYDNNGKVVALVGVDIEASEVIKDINNFTLKLILIVLVFIILSILFFRGYIKRYLKVPIKKLTDLSYLMTNGNLNDDTSINIKSNDEIAILSNNFITLRTTISSYIKEITLILEEISQQNLTISISRAYIGDFSAIKNELNKIIDTLNIVIRDINDSSKSLAFSSRQISGSSEGLSIGAINQQDSIEKLNQTINTLTEEIYANAKLAEKANKLSKDTKLSAVSGNDDMKEMLIAIEEISKESNKISNIINIIDEIAFKTNILAINASIEASRVGEHGKGFAVVANEVRELAINCQEAANNVTSLINNTLSKVSYGKNIANETAEALEIIIAKTSDVSDYIADIASSSKSQEEYLENLNTEISIVHNVTESNTMISQENQATAEELLAQAEVLENAVIKFKLK